MGIAKDLHNFEESLKHKDPNLAINSALKIIRKVDQLQAENEKLKNDIKEAVNDLMRSVEDNDDYDFFDIKYRYYLDQKKGGE